MPTLHNRHQHLTHFPLNPTRVNTSYVRGAIYHWDSITDDEALQLGISQLPGPAQGNAVRIDGFTVRRLKCGRVNVSIESTSPILQDPGITRFMGRVTDPVPCSDIETVRAPLGESDPLDVSDPVGLMGGPVEFEIGGAGGRMSEGARAAIESIGGCTAGRIDLHEHIDQAAPACRPKIRRAIRLALQTGCPFDVEYRLGEGKARLIGKVLRDRFGAPRSISCVLSARRDTPLETDVDALSGGGGFEVDLSDWTIVLSPEALRLGRALNRDLLPVDSFFSNFRRFHADDVPRILDCVKRTVDEGEPWDFSYRVGERRVRSTARITARTPDGKPSRIVGVASILRIDEAGPELMARK